jgi:hypothetical protein
MATVRHRHGRGSAVTVPPRQTSSGADEASHAVGRVFDSFDRPLRFAAGGDVVLLRILRGAAVGFVLAMIAAVTVSAIV